MNITKTKPEMGMRDIMDGDGRWEIQIGDHGLIALLDVMPRMVPESATADFAIAQAARVSYGVGTKKVSEDEGLIRYLYRHRHTTPYEMVEFKFHCAMPIFVARQWIRHRTASVNEYSGRYSVIKERFFHPTKQDLRQQSKVNKQGGTEILGESDAEEFLRDLESIETQCYQTYEKHINKGVARELARVVLPTSIFTEWYWKIDLHNLLNFLSLRMDSHAQKEIRDYADAIYTLIGPIVPIAVKAFDDYHPMRGGMLLSRQEIELIKSSKDLWWFGSVPKEQEQLMPNNREREEWKNKSERLQGS